MLQAIHRMTVSLHMGEIVDGNPEAYMAVKMIIALALLPANLIPLGIDVINHYINQHELEGLHFEGLIGYA